MSNALHKTASIKAKSLKHLTDIIKKQNIKDKSKAGDIAREALMGKSPLPFFTPIFSKLAPKSVREAVKKGYSGVQDALVNLDIAGGSKAHRFFRRRKLKSAISVGKKGISKAEDILSKAKAPDEIAKAKENLTVATKAAKQGMRDARAKGGQSFINKYQVPVGKTQAGRPDTFKEVEVPLATAPFGKAKSAVLPAVGAIAITSKLYKDKSKGGDMVDTKTADKKSELVEKISSILCDEKYDKIKDEQQTSIDIHKISQVVLHASKMLKVAAKESRRLIQENEKLASENIQLNSTISNKAKLENATKLAELMIEKRLIKKAEVDDQIEKIMNLDDTGYGMLKTTIENINVNSVTKEGLDNLTFLDKQINIEDERKRTLEESLSD